MLSQAQVRLVEENLGLARKIAGANIRRLTGDIEADDIAGAAMLGLCRAALRYESCDGVTFNTFASYSIQGAILDLFRREYGRRGEKIRALPLSAFEAVFDDEEHFDWLADRHAGPEELAEDEDEAARAVAAIDLLEPRRAEIVRRHCQGETLLGIGISLRLSEARVSQLRRSALKQLRQILA